jgi:MFS transporter, Spinster family, sphingosine-1-phosphate transporter
LALLLAVNLFNYIDRFVLAAVAPKIQEDFKANDEVTGLLQTAFLVSYMVFAPLFGWLGDRYRRWLLIGVGVVVWSFASGASGLAPEIGSFVEAHIPPIAALFTAFGVTAGIGALLMTRMFVGVGEAAYGPTAPTVISDMYPVARRGQVMAWFYAAIPVGSALGFLLGGLVLKAGLSWHWAFFIVLPPGLLLGVWCFLMRDPPRGAAESVVAVDAPLLNKAKLSDYRILLRTPSFVLNTAGMAAMTFAMGGIAFWMPKYIVWHSHGTIDLGKANAMFGPIIVVSGLLGTLAGGAMGDWLRPRFGGSYFLVSGAAMGIAFPLFLLLPMTPFPLAWVLIFATSFCLFFNTGPTNTILANVTHVSMRAAGYALNIFVIHALGDAISPWLIGRINDHWREGTTENMDPGFIAVSITILLGGLCWLWGARYLARDTELAPTRLES